MNSTKYSINILVLFLIFSCRHSSKIDNKLISEPKDSLKILKSNYIDSIEVDRVNTIISINGDTIIKEQHFVYKEYMFKIKTICLNDSVVDEDPKFNPVVIGQKLFFFKNNSLVNELDNPAKYSERILSSGKSTKIVENVIYKVGVLEGEKGSVFYFEGTGACNACTELRAFYTLVGKIEFCFYGNQDTTFISVGDPNEVYKKYQINEKSNDNSIDLKLVKYFY